MERDRISLLREEAGLVRVLPPPTFARQLFEPGEIWVTPGVLGVLDQVRLGIATTMRNHHLAARGILMQKQIRIALGNRILASLTLHADGRLEFQAFFGSDLSTFERETVLRTYLNELLPQLHELYDSRTQTPEDR